MLANPRQHLESPDLVGLPMRDRNIGRISVGGLAARSGGGIVHRSVMEPVNRYRYAERRPPPVRRSTSLSTVPPSSIRF